MFFNYNIYFMGLMKININIFLLNVTNAFHCCLKLSKSKMIRGDNWFAKCSSKWLTQIPFCSVQKLERKNLWNHLYAPPTSICHRKLEILSSLWEHWEIKSSEALDSNILWGQNVLDFLPSARGSTETWTNK